jgi:hypothetical protein
MLNDLEMMGLKIAVMCRTGELKTFSCSTCSPELQEMRNCSGAVEGKPVLYLPSIGQLNVCPLRLIPDTIYKFLDKNDYIKKFPNSYIIPYEDCNPKFWEAVKMYDNLIAEWEHNQHERRMAEIKK